MLVGRQSRNRTSEYRVANIINGVADGLHLRPADDDPRRERSHAEQMSKRRGIYSLCELGRVSGISAVTTLLARGRNSIKP